MVKLDLKNVNTNVDLGLWCTPMNLFLLFIPFKDKERPAKSNFMIAKLRTVLVSAESDSTWC